MSPVEPPVSKESPRTTAHSSTHLEGSQGQTGWIRSIVLGIVLALIYLSNGREVASYDTEPAALLTRTILRGEGLYLDHFGPIIRDGNALRPGYAEKRGHILSRYPVGPALLALPMVAAETAVFPLIRPGWNQNVLLEWYYSREMAKHASAIIAAMAGVVLYRLLGRIGLGRVALPATLAAALGSNLWTIASQSLWQHGPAALALTTALLLLAVPNPSRLRFLLAGLAAGALVAFRALDIVFAAIITLWVLWHQSRRLAWFLPFPLLIGAALAGTNLRDFGTLLGGQAELEALHPELHGVSGPWSGDMLEGGVGTLFSPSRGLFVYTPWIAIALAVAPWTTGRLRRVPVVPWVLWGLIPFALILSKYAVWWGGFCFGPRYWTDVVPLFAIVLACGLEHARTRSRTLQLVFTMAIVLSIGVQIIGAFCSPSSWSLKPNNIDTHHERLWDWVDNEVTRCLSESLGKIGRGSSR